MFIAYFDETGDDGYPQYSSELFVMTSIYMHFQNWKNNYEMIKDFRRQLKKDFNFPVKTEFHCSHFIKEKNPYRQFKYSRQDKIQIIELFFYLIVGLDVKVINVCIDKGRIKKQYYDILENALKYNIQRIENDLNKINPAHKFLIIADEGRIGKMKNVSRKIQRINFIPSKFNPDSYRSEIRNLIEDPLPKPSQDSYFIQITDLISFFAYLYSIKKFTKGDWASRVKTSIDFGAETKMLDIIKERLNLEASPKQEYGIVHYPK